MKKVYCVLLAGALTALAAQAYPFVSSDPDTVEINVWNTNLAKGKAKAKAVNRPLLLVMLDSQNCSYSRSFLSNIADAPAFQDFLEENPLVLILADKPKMVLSVWYDYTGPFRDGTGLLNFPTVALFRPNGTVADQFLARSALGNNPGFYTRVRGTTDQYPNTSVPPPSNTPPSFSAPTPAPGATVPLVAGSSPSLQVSATGSATISYSATGLPPGLSLSPSTGLISGTVAAIGDWPVSVTALNPYGSATVAFVLRVAPAPVAPAAAAGTYQGFLHRGDRQTVAGTLRLSATTQGALSASAVLGGGSYSFKGNWKAGAPLTARLSSRTTTDTLDVEVDARGILTGAFRDTALLGRLTDRMQTPPLRRLLHGVAAASRGRGQRSGRRQRAGRDRLSLFHRQRLGYGVLQRRTRRRHAVQRLRRADGLLRHRARRSWL